MLPFSIMFLHAQVLPFSIVIYTHGTRSSYNRGCRCDVCREAARVARARQRSAAQERHPSPVSAEYDGCISPWILIVGLAGGAGWCFWRSSRIDATQSPEAAASRRHWGLAG